MTSSDDGKDVRSISTSPKKENIELYENLEARLSAKSSCGQRVGALSDAWRRIRGLCQHSNRIVQNHLLVWIQKHTAGVLLQAEWQSPESTEYHTILKEALDSVVKQINEDTTAVAKEAQPWEEQLVLHAQRFDRMITEPWGHPVLRMLLNTQGERPEAEHIVEWLLEEKGVMLVARLHQLAAAKCQDLALAIITAIMDLVRGNDCGEYDESDGAVPYHTGPSDNDFISILKEEADFSADVWDSLTDMEFVLLHKLGKTNLYKSLVKRLRLRAVRRLIERLSGRLESAPNAKKLWKNAKEVTMLIAGAVVHRCMTVGVCSGMTSATLSYCTRALMRLSGGRPPDSALYVKEAVTAKHLHTFTVAVETESKELESMRPFVCELYIHTLTYGMNELQSIKDKLDKSKELESMRPFVCELYIHTLTYGMNELQSIKDKLDKESEARAMEKTLCTWFEQLGSFLRSSDRIFAECLLTAFSVHPSEQMYSKLVSAPDLPRIKLSEEDEPKEEELKSEYGSWANDSSTKTNFVKTSETLNLKLTTRQTNVLSIALLSEGEELGLSPELCNDLTSLLGGPRVKTLSWDMDRDQLLDNCRTYMERTGGGTKSLVTELKYLNLDPSEVEHLPEEDEDENDIYYGIEKGYEHLVEFQDSPEDMWQDSHNHLYISTDDECTESAHSSSSYYDFDISSKKAHHKKNVIYSDEDSDPLSLNTKTKKKERSQSKDSIRKERTQNRDDKHSHRDKSIHKTKRKSKEKSTERRKNRSHSNDISKKSEHKRHHKKKDESYVEIADKTKMGPLSGLIGMKVCSLSPDISQTEIKRKVCKKKERRRLEKELKKRLKEIKKDVTDSDYDSQGKSSLTSLGTSGTIDSDVLFDGLFSMDELCSPEKCSKHSPLVSQPTTMSLVDSHELSVTNGSLSIDNNTSIQEKPLNLLNKSEYKNSLIRTKCTNTMDLTKKEKLDTRSDITSLNSCDQQLEIANLIIPKEQKPNQVQLNKHISNEKKIKGLKLKTDVKSSTAKLLQFRKQKITVTDKTTQMNVKVLDPNDVYKNLNKLPPTSNTNIQQIKSKLSHTNNSIEPVIQNVNKISSKNYSTCQHKTTKDYVAYLNKVYPNLQLNAVKTTPRILSTNKQTPVKISSNIKHMENESGNNLKKEKSTLSKFDTTLTNVIQHGIMSTQKAQHKMNCNQEQVMQSSYNVNGNVANQKNIQDFVKGLKETINAGTLAQRENSKNKCMLNAVKEEINVLKGNCSISQSPSIPNKPIIQTSVQCAKIPHKKVDDAPNTFARLSYMHKNKQNDVSKIKQLLAKTSVPMSCSKHNLEQLTQEQKLMKLKHLESQGKITVSVLNKPPKVLEKESNIVKTESHPTYTREQNQILNSFLTKNLSPACNTINATAANTSSNINISASHGVIHSVESEKVTSTQTINMSPYKSTLSVSDQLELQRLLWQKNKLNANILKASKAKSDNVEIIQPVTSNSMVQNPIDLHVNIDHSVIDRLLVQNRPSMIVQNNLRIPALHYSSNIRQSNVTENIGPTFQSNTKVSQLCHNTNFVTSPKDTEELQDYKIKASNSITEVIPTQKDQNLISHTGQGCITKSKPNDLKSYPVKKQDWESVLEELLSHQTPSRGDNALDLKLKKDYIRERIKNKSANVMSNQRATKLNNKRKTLKDLKSKKSRSDSTSKANASSLASSTDFPLLDEEIDKDLLREIDELTSDEDNIPSSSFEMIYTKQNEALPAPKMRNRKSLNEVDKSVINLVGSDVKKTALSHKKSKNQIKTELKKCSSKSHSVQNRLCSNLNKASDGSSTLTNFIHANKTGQQHNRDEIRSKSLPNVIKPYRTTDYADNVKMPLVSKTTQSERPKTFVTSKEEIQPNQNYKEQPKITHDSFILFQTNNRSIYVPISLPETKKQASYVYNQYLLNPPTEIQSTTLRSNVENNTSSSVIKSIPIANAKLKTCEEQTVDNSSVIHNYAGNIIHYTPHKLVSIMANGSSVPINLQHTPLTQNIAVHVPTLKEAKLENAAMSSYVCSQDVNDLEMNKNRMSNRNMNMEYVHHTMEKPQITDNKHKKIHSKIQEYIYPSITKQFLKGNSDIDKNVSVENNYFKMTESHSDNNTYLNESECKSLGNINHLDITHTKSNNEFKVYPTDKFTIACQSEIEDTRIFNSCSITHVFQSTEPQVKTNQSNEYFDNNISQPQTAVALQHILNDYKECRIGNLNHSDVNENLLDKSELSTVKNVRQSIVNESKVTRICSNHVEGFADMQQPIFEITQTRYNKDQSVNGTEIKKHDLETNQNKQCQTSQALCLVLNKDYQCAYGTSKTFLETLLEKERVKNKRLSIINRNINNASRHPPITLKYEPLKNRSVYIDEKENKNASPLRNEIAISGVLRKNNSESTSFLKTQKLPPSEKLMLDNNSSISVNKFEEIKNTDINIAAADKTKCANDRMMNDSSIRLRSSNFISLEKDLKKTFLTKCESKINKERLNRFSQKDKNIKHNLNINSHKNKISRCKLSKRSKLKRKCLKLESNPLSSETENNTSETNENFQNCLYERDKKECQYDLQKMEAPLNEVKKPDDTLSKNSNVKESEGIDIEKEIICSKIFKASCSDKLLTKETDLSRPNRNLRMKIKGGKIQAIDDYKFNLKDVLTPASISDSTNDTDLKSDIDTPLNAESSLFGDFSSDNESKNIKVNETGIRKMRKNRGKSNLDKTSETKVNKSSELNTSKVLPGAETNGFDIFKALSSDQSPSAKPDLQCTRRKLRMTIKRVNVQDTEGDKLTSSSLLRPAGVTSQNHADINMNIDSSFPELNSSNKSFCADVVSDSGSINNKVDNIEKHRKQNDSIRKCNINGTKPEIQNSSGLNTSEVSLSTDKAPLVKTSKTDMPCFKRNRTAKAKEEYNLKNKLTQKTVETLINFTSSKRDSDLTINSDTSSKAISTPEKDFCNDVSTDNKNENSKVNNIKDCQKQNDKGNKNCYYSTSKNKILRSSAQTTSPKVLLNTLENRTCDVLCDDKSHKNNMVMSKIKDKRRRNKCLIKTANTKVHKKNSLAPSSKVSYCNISSKDKIRNEETLENKNVNVTGVSTNTKNLKIKIRNPLTAPEICIPDDIVSNSNLNVIDNNQDKNTCADDVNKSHEIIRNRNPKLKPSSLNLPDKSVDIQTASASEKLSDSTNNKLTENVKSPSPFKTDSIKITKDSPNTARIILPNGKVFRATINNTQYSVDTLLSNPVIMRELNGHLKGNVKFTLNVKTASKIRTRRGSRRIVDATCATINDKIETVDLISDDDDNDDIKECFDSFKTEYGIYKVLPVEKPVFLMHQSKFNQKSVVSVQRMNFQAKHHAINSFSHSQSLVTNVEHKKFPTKKSLIEKPIFDLTISSDEESVKLCDETAESRGDSKFESIVDEQRSNENNAENLNSNEFGSTSGNMKLSSTSEFENILPTNDCVTIDSREASDDDNVGSCSNSCSNTLILKTSAISTKPLEKYPLLSANKIISHAEERSKIIDRELRNTHSCKEDFHTSEEFISPDNICNEIAMNISNENEPTLITNPSDDINYKCKDFDFRQCTVKLIKCDPIFEKPKDVYDKKCSVKLVKCDYLLRPKENLNITKEDKIVHDIKNTENVFHHMFRDAEDSTLSKIPINSTQNTYENESFVKIPFSNLSGNRDSNSPVIAMFHGKIDDNGRCMSSAIFTDSDNEHSIKASYQIECDSEYCMTKTMVHVLVKKMLFHTNEYITPEVNVINKHSRTVTHQTNSINLYIANKTSVISDELKNDDSSKIYSVTDNAGRLILAKDSLGNNSLLKNNSKSGIVQSDIPSLLCMVLKILNDDNIINKLASSKNRKNLFNLGHSLKRKREANKIDATSKIAKMSLAPKLIAIKPSERTAKTIINNIVSGEQVLNNESGETNEYKNSVNILDFIKSEKIKLKPLNCYKDSDKHQYDFVEKTASFEAPERISKAMINSLESDEQVLNNVFEESNENINILDSIKNELKPPTKTRYDSDKDNVKQEYDFVEKTTSEVEIVNSCKDVLNNIPEEPNENENYVNTFDFTKNQEIELKPPTKAICDSDKNCYKHQYDFVEKTTSFQPLKRISKAMIKSIESDEQVFNKLSEESNENVNILDVIKKEKNELKPPTRTRYYSDKDSVKHENDFVEKTTSEVQILNSCKDVSNNISEEPNENEICVNTFDFSKNQEIELTPPTIAICDSDKDSNKHQYDFVEKTTQFQAPETISKSMINSLESDVQVLNNVSEEYNGNVNILDFIKNKENDLKPPTRTRFDSDKDSDKYEYDFVEKTTSEVQIINSYKDVSNNISEEPNENENCVNTFDFTKNQEIELTLPTISICDSDKDSDKHQYDFVEKTTSFQAPERISKAMVNSLESDVQVLNKVSEECNENVNILDFIKNEEKDLKPPTRSRFDSDKDSDKYEYNFVEKTISEVRILNIYKQVSNNKSDEPNENENFVYTFDFTKNEKIELTPPTIAICDSDKDSDKHQYDFVEKTATDVQFLNSCKQVSNNVSEEPKMTSNEIFDFINNEKIELKPPTITIFDSDKDSHKNQYDFVEKTTSDVQLLNSCFKNDINSRTTQNDLVQIIKPDIFLGGAATDDETLSTIYAESTILASNEIKTNHIKEAVPLFTQKYVENKLEPLQTKKFTSNLDSDLDTAQDTSEHSEEILNDWCSSRDQIISQETYNANEGDNKKCDNCLPQCIDTEQPNPCSFSSIKTFDLYNQKTNASLLQDNQGLVLTTQASTEKTQNEIVTHIKIPCSVTTSNETEVCKEDTNESNLKNWDQEKNVLLKSLQPFEIPQIDHIQYENYHNPQPEVEILQKTTKTEAIYKSAHESNKFKESVYSNDNNFILKRDSEYKDHKISKDLAVATDHMREAMLLNAKPNTDISKEITEEQLGKSSPKVSKTGSSTQSGTNFEINNASTKLLYSEKVFSSNVNEVPLETKVNSLDALNNHSVVSTVMLGVHSKNEIAVISDENYIPKANEKEGIINSLDLQPDLPNDLQPHDKIESGTLEQNCEQTVKHMNTETIGKLLPENLLCLLPAPNDDIAVISQNEIKSEHVKNISCTFNSSDLTTDEICQSELTKESKERKHSSEMMSGLENIHHFVEKGEETATDSRMTVVENLGNADKTVDTDFNNVPKNISVGEDIKTNDIEVLENIPRNFCKESNSICYVESTHVPPFETKSNVEESVIYLKDNRENFRDGEICKILVKNNCQNEESDDFGSVAINDYFMLTPPNKTYSTNALQDNNETGLVTFRGSLKRKNEATLISTNVKKIRKGKNIDMSRASKESIEGTSYKKQFDRMSNYYKSLKFSYYHSFGNGYCEYECLEAKKWPLTLESNLNDAIIFNRDDGGSLLFVENEESESYSDSDLTLSDEMSMENLEKDFPSFQSDEHDLNMGFGEESDRVILNSKRDINLSKRSAATLSDVKHPQPCPSENCENNKNTSNIIQNMNKLADTEKFTSLSNEVKKFFENINIKQNFTNSKRVVVEHINSSAKLCRMLNNVPGLYDTEFIRPSLVEQIVQVVQVGQLPVSAAAQNPVSCDSRVSQATDASPSQCSVENSPHSGINDNAQTNIVKNNQYTELTTADLNMPIVQHTDNTDQNTDMSITQNSNISPTQNISVVDNKTDKNENVEQAIQNHCNESNGGSTVEPGQTSQVNNVDYRYDNTSVLTSEPSVQVVFNTSAQHTGSESYLQQKQENGSVEKSDQIANAMNAAGIATTNTRAHALVNILSQKIIRPASVSTAQTGTNNYSKTTSINTMSIQQALAQILPPPLNQTSNTENGSSAPQVLHIVQGKNATGNQITLLDNSQQSVINSSNATQVLHIVQNKSATNGTSSNSTQSAPPNSFGGISLVDAGLPQGSSQLLHIVNTGNNQKNNSGQLLKRVNLLTNIANVQGGNEQKMVQFVCKSADGKAIQLNAPHQRSMVLRLQPIERPPVQTTTTKPTDIQTESPTNPVANSLTSKDIATTQEIKSRSVYEENYAKFIQSSSTKQSVVLSEKSTCLPKFNQAFGKAVFQDGVTLPKQNEVSGNSSHIAGVNNATEATECTEGGISLDHIGQISSPPLLLRKSPAQTSQSQSNIVQQIKQTISPMNIQTMHGGVIYTRQIPVNIGGGQTINLITVPSTELIDESTQKPSDVKFVSQGEIEPSIIKIVPQNQTPSEENASEDNGQHANTNNDSVTSQPQPVLTQMRIKLPMLSKTPQVVPGARVVRPSLFQIQRNVIGGANQPVYQQLVLTAAPPLGQQTIRLPQSQTTRQVKVPSDNQTESQLSSSTLEQLREFDMVLEQVKERSTVHPTGGINAFTKLHSSPTSDTTDSSSSATPVTTEQPQQVLYSIGGTQALNVTYVSRKPAVATPTTVTYVRSPDSSGIADSPSPQIAQNVPDSPVEAQHKTKMNTKPVKSRPSKISSTPPNSVKVAPVPSKTSAQKPLEDEQTTQRILYILAEYKEQVENSPDKDKPAPRRRSNPPSNPSGSSKRKKSSSGSRRPGGNGRDSSPVTSEDPGRTMGSEDSSCGTSQGDCNENCGADTLSPQDSPRKVARKLPFEQETAPPTPAPQTRPQPQRNVIVADGQTIAVTRGPAGKPATAVLMPANYILPVSMMKGGQQIAIVTNRGPKLLTVGAAGAGAEGGAANALLLQRLIGPGGLKPVLTRPGVRHVRLPTGALHNLQAFNLAAAAPAQPTHAHDPAASPAAAPTPPDSGRIADGWGERSARADAEPGTAASPEGADAWRLPSAPGPHDYAYDEPAHRADGVDRPVLDSLPDRFSPDMEAQRIFDKMFDVGDAKKTYMTEAHEAVSPPRVGHAFDIDAPHDAHDKGYPQVVSKKVSGDSSGGEVSGVALTRASLASAAALRHKYAMLEHELRLQKSLSEECEDLGVDSPSASELFPEADLLFAASPAHDHGHEHAHAAHIPQPTLLGQQSVVSQPDLDDEMATDHRLLPESRGRDELSQSSPGADIDTGLGLTDVGVVAVDPLNHEEFARSHPNTTFHSEPTEDAEVQPFSMSSLKGRHITSTIFHASGGGPGTVLMTAGAGPGTGAGPSTGAPLKYTDIGNVIESMAGRGAGAGLARYDVLGDARELHLHAAPAGTMSAGAHVIRRVRYDLEEADALIAGDDAKMSVAEDSSRDATLESMAGDADDDRSSPDRHPDLFWESNSASERSDARRPLDSSSPSLDETNSTDSSGPASRPHPRLHSVIKEARTRRRSASADGSSADDAHPPVRTYPAKRPPPSLSGKTRAGDPPHRPQRRRASARGVVKRGCHCCNGSPAPPHHAVPPAAVGAATAAVVVAPPRPKKPRTRRPPAAAATAAASAPPADH